MSEPERASGMSQVMDRRGSNAMDLRTRVAGAWLAIGAVLFVPALVLHPPLTPDWAAFMAAIAAEPTRWAVIHWVAAGAFAAFVIAGLLILTSHSPFVQTWWTLSAWAVVVVGAFWFTLTAIAEATVVTAAAVAGDVTTFEAWLRFSFGSAVGVRILIPAIGVIAADEALSDRSVTASWAAWLGSLSAVVAIVGFIILFDTLGLVIGALIGLPALILTFLWMLWFGIGLARTAEGVDLVPTVEPSQPKGV